MTLFIDGCMRPDSRTWTLTQTVLERFSDVEIVSLAAVCPTGLTPDTLKLRTELLERSEFTHPMFTLAHQFAAADTIVVAAPYWDLLFPAVVRAYFELITVAGITFQYDDHGVPHGLCRARRLIYVTTAGGPIVRNFGFEYIEAVAKTFFGIAEVQCLAAEGLDVWGADVEAILSEAKARARAL